MKVNEDNLWEVSRAKQNLEEFMDFIKLSMPAEVSQGDGFDLNEGDDVNVAMQMKGFPNEYSDVVERPTLVIWIFGDRPQQTIHTISKHVTGRGAEVELQDGPGVAKRKMLVYYNVISSEEKREVMDKLDF